jgi:SagB-type dehydrogenase family enzyme
MRGPIQLRRASSLFAYWRDGRLVFHNFATRETIAAQPIACDVLDFFRLWRTPERAVAHFKDFSRKSVIAGIGQLRRHRLLLVKGSSDERRDSLLAKTWSAWLPEAGFHFSTKDFPYVKDRKTANRLVDDLFQTRSPALFTARKRSEKFPLPKRVFPDSEFVRVLLSRRTHRRFSTGKVSLETVSQLLSLVWGVTGFIDAGRFGKLLRKTSPSGGARHPGEVYLMALRVSGLKPGLYHYQPLHHDLERISADATPRKARLYCAGQDFVKGAAALFLMTAVFPRTMWKYPFARAYRVVLLDAGHLCQTFCLVATWLGLAPFCTAALKDTLIEEDLGIDGVRESVLYVAGIGLPRSARAGGSYLGASEATISSNRGSPRSESQYG